MNLKKTENAGAMLARFARAGMAPGVTSVAIGDPNRPMPRCISSGINAALLRGRAPYTPATGFGEVRGYFARKLAAEGLRAGVENTIVSAGATPLLAAAFQTLVNPGDRVLVISPYYPKFVDGIRRAGGIPVVIGFESWKALLHGASGSSEDPDLAQVVGVVHNSPVNPAGYVYTEEETRALAARAEARGWWIVSDETYWALNYTDDGRVSVGSLLPNSVVTVRSCSKEWAMPGARLGYATGPEQVIEVMSGYLTDQVGCPNIMIQHAVIFAAAHHREELARFPEELKADLAKSRELMSQLVSGYGLRVARMDGAFYAWVDVTHDRPRFWWQGSEWFAEQLLANHKVAVIPAAAFGALSAHDDYVRVSYAANEEALRRAFEAIDQEIRSH